MDVLWEALGESGMVRRAGSCDGVVRIHWEFIENSTSRSGTVRNFGYEILKRGRRARFVVYSKRRCCPVSHQEGRIRKIYLGMFENIELQGLSTRLLTVESSSCVTTAHYTYSNVLGISSKAEGLLRQCRGWGWRHKNWTLQQSLPEPLDPVSVVTFTDKKLHLARAITTNWDALIRVYTIRMAFMVLSGSLSLRSLLFRILPVSSCVFYITWCTVIPRFCKIHW